MSMTVIATIVARPGAAQTVAAALQAMVEPTLGEPDCLLYDVFASKEAAGTFYLLESHVDEAALAAHHVSPHFRHWWRAWATSWPARYTWNKFSGCENMSWQTVTRITVACIQHRRHITPSPAKRLTCGPNKG